MLKEGTAAERQSRGLSRQSGTVALDASRDRVEVNGSGGVTCVYCGGRHGKADEVRACWQRSQHHEVVVPGSPLPVPVAQPAPGGQMRPLLGRSVLVEPGQPAPEAWVDCERSTGNVEELEAAWRNRRPLVIEVAAEPAEDEIERRPVWSLTPSFSFAGERLAHAMFANAVEARKGELSWRWAEEAVKLGAAAGGPADVRLPDGRPAICDGGPLEWHGEVAGAVVVPRIALLAGALVPFGSNETSAELAPDQLAAVCHPGGAARIIAPAGSGKTRVLTERARHLLGRWHLPARALTLVAFNRRAAEQMSERTPDLPDLQIRTLNALGLSLVNRSQRATTIEERDVRSILDSLVDLPRRANTDPAAAWMEALSAVRLGLQDPAEVEAEFGGDVQGLPGVFERYRRVLADRGVLDFDEQIYRSIELLLTDPAARRSARSACRLLLVDEFQDLTPAHLLLVRLLAGPDGAVFGVGDDDQTIYGYSGASPEWLIDYRRFFPLAGEHPLEVNYRCPVPVVTAARTLLTHNRQRVPKTILPAPGRSTSGSELRVVGPGDALASTVAAVEALVGEGVGPRDVAVLTRVNASLAPVQVALVHRGVPVRTVIDESYLSRGGVQASLAWLRLAAADPRCLEGADVAFAARRPSRGLSPKVADWMSEQRSIAELERLARRVGTRDEKKILGFVSDLKVVRRAASSGTTAGALLAVRDRVGLDQAMQLLESSRRRLDRSAQTDDLNALVALAALHPEPCGFEPWLRESLRHPGHVDGVTLATIHSVKGREWPHVVVHDVSDGLLPHRLASDVEEERRVFHVAITRGSSSATVVAGEPASSFVAELTEEWAPSSARASARPAPSYAMTPARAKARLAPQPPPAASVVERASVALRAWRGERARVEGKPAYVFFSDKTLEAIAAAMPSTMSGLSGIKGIGPAKLEAYGDDLLALLDSVRDE